MQKSSKQEIEHLLKGQLTFLITQLDSVIPEPIEKNQSPTGGQEGGGKGRK